MLERQKFLNSIDSTSPRKGHDVNLRGPGADFSQAYQRWLDDYHRVELSRTRLLDTIRLVQASVDGIMTLDRSVKVMGLEVNKELVLKVGAVIASGIISVVVSIGKDFL